VEQCKPLIRGERRDKLLTSLRRSLAPLEAFDATVGRAYTRPLFSSM